jgi:glycosyltransferase involved in cell wall biosynthesis
MRILYVHQHFCTPQGSTGIRSYQMAKRLVARGHSVLMVCGAEARAATGLSGPFTHGVRRGYVDGIEVLEFDLDYSNDHNFLKRTSTFFRYAWRSSLIALREPYDLLFATSTPLTTGITGLVGKMLRRKPFVFEVRDLWPEIPRALGVIRNPAALSMMSVLEWCSYRAADRLIGLSPGIVEGIARRGRAREHIALIPNGCDLDIFDSESQPWRPDGVAEADLMAVFSGAHGIANGLETAIDAAEDLQRRGRTDIKIVLIGSGMQKPALQQRAARLGLRNVIFLSSVNKHQLAGLFRAADIGLQVLANVPAFYYGTSPNKFFDYLAAGLPVLVNYPGWVAQLVTQNDCGYAVDGDRPDQFAAALVHGADHRSELAEKGARARTLARSQFERNALAEKFVEWIEGSQR